MTVLMKHGELIHSTITYVKWYPIKMCVKAITLTQFEYNLRKIPVLRLNFTRLSAREIFRLSTGIFSKYPSQA
jgi:hypothetical protein